MFEKNMRIALLLDFYGEALDEHTKEIMTSYYEDDLSLSEIANGENISRQGVRHIIKKGEEQLDFLESKLKLAELYDSLSAAASKLNRVKAALLDSQGSIEEVIKLIVEASAIFLNK